MTNSSNKRGKENKPRITGDNTFPKRMRMAITHLGLSVKQASVKLAEHIDSSQRTIESHALGQRHPRPETYDKIVSAYAEGLGVSATWLKTGKGEPEFQHNDKLTADLLSASQIRESRTVAFARPAHFDPVPGVRRARAMKVPIPVTNAKKSFLWQVPEGDHALVGDGYDFVPGKLLVIEPLSSADILPGQIILCRPRGFGEWTLRLFKANWPYSKVKQFSLVSPNPLFDVIENIKVSDCGVAGKVTFSINQW